MTAKFSSPPGLPAGIAGPLIEAAQSVATIAPWEFMSDLELIGLRDEAGDELHVASVLGTLGTLFAIVIYRHDTGLRWIRSVAASRSAPARHSGLEDMDCLKVEWTAKRELSKPDLATLAAAGFKPAGKGPVWPRFESCQPGWYPWVVNEAEARLLTEHLRKIARFVRLRERAGVLHQEPLEAQVPIIPAGDQSSLKLEDIEWVPLVPRPALSPEPIVLTASEQKKLAALPLRKDCTFEFIAPLLPELSFFDERAGRPCIGRTGLMIDRSSQFIFNMHLVHGAAPLREAAHPVLVNGLCKAGARPGAIHVDNERLAAVLRSACEAVGIPVRQAGSLKAAEEALLDLEKHFGTRG